MKPQPGQLLFTCCSPNYHSTHYLSLSLGPPREEKKNRKKKTTTHLPLFPPPLPEAGR